MLTLLASSEPRVRVKRAIASKRITRPITGMRSQKRSSTSRPRFVRATAR